MNTYQNYIEHFEKMESYIPIDLLSLTGFITAVAVVFLFVLFRYFAFVVPVHFLLWRKNSLSKKLQSVHDLKVKKKQISTEIKWSTLSSVFFAGSAFAMGVLWQLGWTKIYLKFDEYSYWMIPISFVALLLIHEFYFYVTHVWMHKPKIFKRVHAVHHFSTKPSAFASFSFHPIEALIHAIFLPLFVLFIPVHPTVLIFYLTFMTLVAISNHSGFELLYPKFLRRFLISGEHHAEHHKYFNCNYGLYFCFIDKVFKTERKTQL